MSFPRQPMLPSGVASCCLFLVLLLLLFLLLLLLFLLLGCHQLVVRFLFKEICAMITDARVRIAGRSSSTSTPSSDSYSIPRQFYRTFTVIKCLFSLSFSPSLHSFFLSYCCYHHYGGHDDFFSLCNPLLLLLLLALLPDDFP